MIAASSASAEAQSSVDAGVFPGENGTVSSALVDGYSVRNLNDPLASARVAVYGSATERASDVLPAMEVRSGDVANPSSNSTLGAVGKNTTVEPADRSLLYVPIVITISTDESGEVFATPTAPTCGTQVVSTSGLPAPTTAASNGGDCSCSASNTSWFGAEGEYIFSKCGGFDVKVISCCSCDCWYMGPHPITGNTFIWMDSVSDCDIEPPIWVKII